MRRNISWRKYMMCVKSWVNDNDNNNNNEVDYTRARVVVCISKYGESEFKLLNALRCKSQWYKNGRSIALSSFTYLGSPQPTVFYCEC